MRLKGGFETTDRRLDRVPQWDQRSRNFPVTALVPRKTFRSYTWARSPQLDQGQEGACVGFGHVGRYGARPGFHNDVNNPMAFSVYTEARTIDEWPGEDYEGTSVLAGAKVMTSRGFYSEYRWCFGIDDVIMAIGYVGPVVFGLPWRDSMFQPDPNGFLDISGSDAGGHCIYGNSIMLRRNRFTGTRLKEPAIVMPNSWGPTYGVDGQCIIYASDLEQLLNAGGEACAPVEAR